MQGTRQAPKGRYVEVRPGRGLTVGDGFPKPFAAFCGLLAVLNHEPSSAAATASLVVLARAVPGGPDSAAARRSRLCTQTSSTPRHQMACAPGNLEDAFVALTEHGPRCGSKGEKQQRRRLRCSRHPSVERHRSILPTTRRITLHVIRRDGHQMDKGRPRGRSGRHADAIARLQLASLTDGGRSRRRVNRQECPQGVWPASVGADRCATPRRDPSSGVSLEGLEATGASRANPEVIRHRPPNDESTCRRLARHAETRRPAHANREPDAYDSHRAPIIPPIRGETTS
jgi:hypothetical protein